MILKVFTLKVREHVMGVGAVVFENSVPPIWLMNTDRDSTAG